MINETDFFKLYACCIPVKGAKRSGICDLQRGTFETIPNSLFEILDRYKNVQYSKIITKTGRENNDTVNEFFNWLIQKEFGFWCKSKKEALQFEELNKDWDTPYDLSNAIIDIDPKSTTNYSELFQEIRSIGIPHIQVRLFLKGNLDFLTPFIALLEGSRTKTIDIVLPYDSELKEDDLLKICRKNLLINSIVFHGAPTNETINLLEGLTKILYSKEKMQNAKQCGCISPSYFSINSSLFTESQNHNSCLNRKMSIDVNGEIKNCPSMQKSFGNIKETKLRDVLGKSDFKDLWNINKDKIKICQDCEFRFICTDCRAFIEDPEDIYSKPLKCGYDPYTAKWEKWSTHTLKQKAIEFYEMHG